MTERPDWCDDPKRPGEESCGSRLAEALEAALARLRRDYGPDMAQWKWGRAHVAVFANPVFSRIPVLRDWLEITIPTPGAYDTLNRGPSTIRDEAKPFEHRFGAGLRMIIDLASPEDARMIATPGQSGDPLSAHSADLLRRWRDFDWLVPVDPPRLHPRLGSGAMNDLGVNDRPAPLNEYGFESTRAFMYVSAFPRSSPSSVRNKGVDARIKSAQDDFKLQSWNSLAPRDQPA